MWNRAGLVISICILIAPWRLCYFYWEVFRYDAYLVSPSHRFGHGVRSGWQQQANRRA